jgi:type I restriction enzyme S subunit
MKFYRETEFQETEIGKIPKDWKTAKINELFELYKGTTPSTKIKSYWDGDIPFVTPTDITSTKSIYLIVTEKYLSKEGLQSKKLKLVPENSLLFTSRATIGYLAINRQKVAVNQGIIALIPRKSNVSYLFYYYYLLYKRKMLEELAGGSTYKEISMNIFSKVTVSLPPFEEQQRITDILSTVDKTLVDVDETISRLERLKKALMGELLAGRIRVKEVDGKLTFYRETEFQETEIGKIPKDWKTAKLKDVAEIRGNKKPTGNIKHVTFIPMEAIPDNKIYTQYEILDMHEVKSFVYCEPGDILLAKITPSFENGKQGIVPLEIPGNFALATTEVYPIKCKNIDAFYLFYLLKFSPNRNKLKSLMRGTTGRRRVPRDALEMLTVPIPPRNEQQKIAEILSTFDRAIEFYRYERSKLEKLKNGLMSVLLTGKVRVRED